MKTIESLTTKLDKLKEARRMIDADILNCENEIKQAKIKIEDKYRSYVGKKATV